VIEIAGGNDVFPELREKGSAADRVVDPGEVVRRDPQIIVASWCGKKLEPERIRSRPGWDRVSAVRENRIYELDGADILAPGPSVMVGLRLLHEIIQG
jgi:iron complex transport system substrate-binding protein